MDNNIVGCLAEYKFAVKAMEIGFCVSFPLLNSSPYDCIIDTPNGLKKIQIKSINTLGKRQKVLLTSNNKKNYDLKDVDFFAVYSFQKNGFFILKNDGKQKSIELTSPKNSKYFNNFAQL